MTYRLYVDEVGNDDLGHVHQDENRFLSLTGVAIQQDHARNFLSPTLATLKSDIFHHDPDVPLILHRTDIVQKKGPFGVLNDPAICKTFDDRIVATMTAVQHTVITAVLDKRAMMQQRHWNNTHPYHYLLEILVEKYVQFLERRGSLGDIMPEMRRGPQDVALQREYERVRDQGTNFVSPARMKIQLPAKELKFRAKSENIAGLQLCDLMAHPSYIYVRKRQGHAVTIGPFAGRVVEVLVGSKYDRSTYFGKIAGYGIKYLP